MPSFVNECQKFHFKKILQLEKSKSEKNRSRRSRKIVKSNGSYDFLLKDEYWFDVSIISKSPNNNSILKKRDTLYVSANVVGQRSKQTRCSKTLQNHS